jgi:hypothetical protein
LIGQIEASDEAQEKYSDAIAEGKGAYLLSQKRSDIVTLYIGKFFVIWMQIYFEVPR